MTRPVLLLCLLVPALGACHRQAPCDLVEGVVGQGCVSGQSAFRVKATIAAIASNGVAVGLMSDPLECKGALTRSSPGMARLKRQPGSSTIDLVVFLPTGVTVSPDRYPITNSDERVGTGTWASIDHIPEGEVILFLENVYTFTHSISMLAAERPL